MADIESRFQERNFRVQAKSFLLSIGIIAVYLFLVGGAVLAQLERSIDKLSLSRTFLTGQSLANLLAQASGYLNDLSKIPDLYGKVEKTLLSDSEINAVLIRLPDSTVIASTGSEEILKLISQDWDRRAIRHFSLQGQNHPYVIRSNGVEFCAVEARNISEETVGIVWLARHRATAQRAVETAFGAVLHTVLVLGFPAFLLTSLFLWIKIKKYHS